MSLDMLFLCIRTIMAVIPKENSCFCPWAPVVLFQDFRVSRLHPAIKSEHDSTLQQSKQPGISRKPMRARRQAV